MSISKVIPIGVAPRRGWQSPRRPQSNAQTPGIREVSASPRTLIPLQTRLRYTTMVVLPEGEEILDVICGDKDFWVISADPQHRAREAREGGRGHEPESRDG